MAQLGSALDWESRGRRFKSCHPDWDKEQVRGRFREIGNGLFRVRRPKCSNAYSNGTCSNGTHSHRPIAAESRSTAERAPSVETWPYTAPVTATEECPSSSETVCSGTPASSMCVANECLSVCRPTPVMPEALAAVLIARSAFLGSTAAPDLRGEDVARLNPYRGCREPLDRLVHLDRRQQRHSCGGGARHGVTVPSWAH